MTGTLARVAILMCTYNGERFLAEQMKSFFSQTHTRWELWVSDDGSSDATMEVIRRFQNRGKKIHFLTGPGKGYAANFLFLTRNPEIDADYFVWSDQDDIWLPEKLARAISWLTSQDNSTPALYAGRTILVDEQGKMLSFSPRFFKPAGFRNALCQNIGGGNTMAFNRATQELFSCGGILDIVAHDWWAYMLVTGTGGSFHFDPEPVLLYRQHDSNLIGGNSSPLAKIRRLRHILSGRYHIWNKKNITALAKMRHYLTPENIAVFDAFVVADRKDCGIAKLCWLLRSSIYRQSAIDDLVFRVAALMKKYP